MQFTKHIYVLHLLSTIPAPVMGPMRDYYGKPSMGVRSPMTDKEATTAFDHLFGYIHAHWADPLTAISSGASFGFNARWTVAEQQELSNCKAMLIMSSEELADRLASLPPYFAEHIFPVSVARYLLRDIKIPLDHRKNIQFREFHRRYGQMVLCC